MLQKEKTFEFSLEGFAQAKAYKPGIPEGITNIISNTILPITLLGVSTFLVPTIPVIAPLMPLVPIAESIPLFIYI